MNQVIQIALDERGTILIPASEREHLQLAPGMTLVVENGEEGSLRLMPQEEESTLVWENGILIARGELLEDATDIVKRNREEYLARLMARIGE